MNIKLKMHYMIILMLLTTIVLGLYDPIWCGIYTTFAIISSIWYIGVWNKLRNEDRSISKPSGDVENTKQ